MQNYHTSNKAVRELIHSLQDDPADVDQIVRQVREAAQEFFKTKVDVKPIGSAGSGLGSFESDVDLVIVNEADSTGLWGQQKSRAQTALAGVTKILRAKDRWQQVEFVKRARVPVLKMKRNGREIDITYNNTLPCHNTRLLKTYVKLFDPLADLIRLIRHWAKLNGVHGAANGHFSSYSWALLTTFAMQIKHGLPSLQALATERKYICLEEDIETNVAFESRPSPLSGEAQKAPIEDLFYDFFHYYGEVWERGKVASIRLGREATIDDVELNELHLPFNERLTLNLEDPFDYSVKGTGTYRRNLAVTLNTPTLVLDKIKSSWKKLKAQTSASLIDITVTMTKYCNGCNETLSFEESCANKPGKGVWCVNCYVEWERHNDQTHSSSNWRGRENAYQQNTQNARPKALPKAMPWQRQNTQQNGDTRPRGSHDNTARREKGRTGTPTTTYNGQPDWREGWENDADRWGNGSNAGGTWAKKWSQRTKDGAKPSKSEGSYYANYSR